MAQFTGNWNQFYGKNMLPAVERVIFNRFKGHKPAYNRIAEVAPSERSIEQIAQITGFGQFRKVDEGQSVTYDTMKQLPPMTFEHTDFGLAFMVTRKLIRDDKYRLVKKMATDLPDAARETIEVQGAAVLNGAFSTTLLPTGLSLCNANHVIVKGGGLQSNVLAAADPSVTTFQQALTLFETQRAQNGRLIKWNKATFVGPPGLRFKFAELLKSTDRPDTANRATNAMKYAEDGMPDMFIHKWLAGSHQGAIPNAWFLKADPESSGIIWFWREKPNMDHWMDKPTRSAHHAMWYAFSTGAYDYAGIVGNPGV